MQKSVTEILKVFERKTLDYQQMSIQKAKDSCKILERILNRSVYRSELAIEFQKIKNGRLVLSNYPKQAGHVSFPGIGS